MCNSIFILVKRISLNVILLLSLLLDCGHMQIAFSSKVFSQLLNNIIIFIFRDILDSDQMNGQFQKPTPFQVNGQLKMLICFESNSDQAFG